ncbi:uncharacterized protein L199_005179 [Kwoniella botswanensis]|uniref:uncharacterized protein n=1 Tax=Kwoniella botswanensis TaxID=1268659 RepID=UPI00315D989E
MSDIELKDLSTTSSLSDLEVELKRLQDNHKELNDLMISQNQSGSDVDDETAQVTRLSWVAIGRQIAQVRTKINSQNANSSSS